MKANGWRGLLESHVVVLVLALLVLVPLLFAGPQVRRADQITTYGVLGLVLLVVWLLRAQGTIDLAKARTFITSGPNLPIALFVVWSVVTAALSSYPAYSRLALVQLLFGALLYVIVAYEFRRKEQVQALLSLLLVMGVVLVLAAFVLDADQGLVDLAGSFHDHQLFGAFLGLIFPVAMGVAAGNRHRWWKIGWQIATILIAAAAVLTRCRSTWLGMLVAGIVFAFLALVHGGQWKGLSRKKHELIVTPLLAAVVLGMFMLLTSTGGPLQFRLGTFGALGQDGSFKWRLEMWQAALQAIQARPVTGWGPGAYAFAQIPYNPSSRAAETIVATGPSMSENAHNAYLQIAAEQGLIGLALYLAILVWFFRTALRALLAMNGGLRKYVLIGCTAAVAGQCVDALGNPGWMFPEVSTFFWLVLGLGMCAAGVRPETAADTATSGPAAAPQRWYQQRRLRTAAVLAGAFFLGTVLLQPRLSSVLAAPDDRDQVRQTAVIPDYVYGDESVLNDKIKGPLTAGAGGGGGAILVAGDRQTKAALVAAFAPCEPCECAERLPILPPEHERITEIRMSPRESTLRAGFCRCFYLEVKSERDGKWYSVTYRRESILQVRDPETGLRKKAGTQSVFCVPLGLPETFDDTIATVVGTFTPPNGMPMTAEARVRLDIPRNETPGLPPDHEQVTDIRILPRETTLKAGCCGKFELEVKSARDGKWYDVTQHSRSRIEIVDPHGCLVKEDPDGSVFCVAHDAPLECDQTTVEVIGTFTPASGEPLHATSKVHISITGERYPTLPAGHEEFTDWRIFPDTSTVRLGCCVALHLEVRSKHDNKWYSVTRRDETLFYTRDSADTRLVRKQLLKSVFCARATGRKGRPVVVIGAFNPPGGRSYQADAHVRIEGTGHIEGDWEEREEAGMEGHAMAPAPRVPGVAMRTQGHRATTSVAPAPTMPAAPTGPAPGPGAQHLSELLTPHRELTAPRLPPVAPLTPDYRMHSPLPPPTRAQLPKTVPQPQVPRQRPGTTAVEAPHAPVVVPAPAPQPSPQSVPQPMPHTPTTEPAPPVTSVPESPAPAKPPVTTAGGPWGGYYRVRLGWFATRPEAVAERKRVAARSGRPTSLVQAGNGFQVQVGAYRSRQAAEAVAEALRARGLQPEVTTSR